MRLHPNATRPRTVRTTLGVSVCLCLALAACGNGRQDSSAEGDITATDLAGNEVTLASPAERVVAIPIPAASMIVTVNGGPDALVGMNPSAKEALEKGYLGEVYPELAEVPSDVTTRDFAPVMEPLLKTEPDLVIQWGDEGAGLVDPLVDADLTVAQLMYGTQEYLEGAVELYGELLDKQDRSEKIINRMHSDLEEYEDREELPKAERPKVLHFSGV